MLRPDPEKPTEWFVDGALPEKLVGIPGWKVDGRGRFRIPRNLLPLLDDDPHIAKLIAGLNAGARMTWAERKKRDAVKGFELRTTQNQAIDFIQRRRGTLIGDDMRLGKTVTGLCAHDPKDGQLAIVAPLSARAVWLGWAKRVFPDTPIGVCLGKKLDREVLDLPIIFVHYEIVRYWNILRKFGTVIFDEAHHLGNIKTKRMTAACTMASWAHRVIALTGTPIWNMPEDLWSLISLLAQGAWGSFYDFANRYAAPESTAYGTRWTGSSNEAELKLRLTEVMLRRKWVDCVDDLPAISRSVLVAEVDQRTSSKLDIIAAKIKSESRSNAAGNLAAYRRQLTGVKLKTVVDEARKVMSRGEPVVVWTWHKEFATAIANELGTNEIDGAPKTAYLMHGDIVADKREAVMAAWKSQPHAALVATMSVGQVAIDLSHARIAIFGEVDWTPAVIAQAEMRTFSPLRGMDILFVVAAHVIDQRLVRALVGKLGAQDSLGVGAACDAIDALRSAVMGAEEVGDLDRLMESMLEAA